MYYYIFIFESVIARTSDNTTNSNLTCDPEKDLKGMKHLPQSLYEAK